MEEAEDDGDEKENGLLLSLSFLRFKLRVPNAFAFLLSSFFKTPGHARRRSILDNALDKDLARRGFATCHAA